MRHGTADSTVSADASGGRTVVEVATADDPVRLGEVLWILLTTVGAYAILLGAAFFMAGERSADQAWDILLLALSIAVPALVTFFGAITIRGDMRDAIASAFIVSFLLLLVTTVMLPFGLSPTEGDEGGSIRSELLGNFTGLMGVLVAFYFGSEGAIAVAKQIFVGRVATAAAGSAAATSPVVEPAPAAGGATAATHIDHVAARPTDTDSMQS